MILTIGDSFTYGHELTNPTRDAWPFILGKLLDQPVVNWGLTGSSNQRINRLAVTNITKFDLIICAWTGIDRDEVSFQDKLVQLSFNDPGLPNTFPWLKSYISDHYNYQYYLQSWIINVLTLQAYFQQHNQPFLFVNAVYKGIPLILEYLWNRVDDLTFFDKNKSMQDWCKHCEHGPQSHFLEAGHELVAQRLAQYIKDKSLIRRDV